MESKLNFEEIKEKLLEASHDGNEDEIKLIIENKEIIEQLLQLFEEDIEFTPLHFAAQNGHNDCLDSLLSNIFK